MKTFNTFHCILFLSGYFLLNSFARSSDESLWLNNTNLIHAYSFSAPAVSDDWLYMTTFSHDDIIGWFGSLYKFQLTEKGEVFDRLGKPVFDCNGTLKSSAQSFWSASDHADSVNTVLKNKNDRKLFTDSEQGKSFKFSPLSDTDKESIPTTLGDSMHSSPVVLDYGSLHTKHDRRILLATNTGLLHLFRDNGDQLEESWAFIPAEFVIPLENDRHAKRYALDGKLTIYHNDIDHDGIIESSEGDRLWLFFGLRQGGRSYYAIDLTEPDHPILKWKITGGEDSAYTLLGETWSVPQLAHIAHRGKLNSPVIIVGGGNEPLTSAESEKATQYGRAIYIIDADSGQKLLSISAEADSLTNLQAPLEHSIPATVAVLDSDLDGFDDRFYVGDTGGQVWRVDMNGDFSNWQITQLASLQATDVSLSSKLPRFFGQPVIARSLLRTKIKQNDFVDVPADWVMLGSGERDDVQSVSDNQYVALPDLQVKPYTKQDEIAAPLTMKDLHPIFHGKDRNQPSNAFMKGWYANLAQEKVFGNGYVIGGKVWFTSFLSAAKSNAIDKMQSIGSTQLYQIDLVTGSYSEEQPMAEQYADRLLDDLGVSYQEPSQQLWMTGLPSRKTSNCSNVGMSISSALQPRKIAEYFSND